MLIITTTPTAAAELVRATLASVPLSAQDYAAAANPTVLAELARIDWRL